MTDSEFIDASTRLLELEYEIRKLPLWEIYEKAKYEGAGSINNLRVIRVTALAAMFLNVESRKARNPDPPTVSVEISPRDLMEA